MSKKNYASQKPGGLIDYIILKKRIEIFNLFLKEFPDNYFDTVLDAGVTSDMDSIATNFFEKRFINKHKIIALSNQDATFLEDIYPGLKFKFGDVKYLPFEDQSVDVVFSSAVIEHVGSIKNQKKMISECVRVSRMGIFITTPNRWYPVDFHTFLPFIHWLPKNIHRNILNFFRFQFYSNEENLNLLDYKLIFRICKELSIKNFFIKKITTLGFVSNLILVVKK